MTIDIDWNVYIFSNKSNFFLSFFQAEIKMYSIISLFQEKFLFSGHDVPMVVNHAAKK